MIFEYGKRYTLDEVAEIVSKAPTLAITDCLEDENPHFTIGVGFEGEPLYQFHPVSDEYWELTWTDWD